jgi:hypothetical protein
MARWLVCGRSTVWGTAFRDDITAMLWLRRRENLPHWMYY